MSYARWPRCSVRSCNEGLQASAAVKVRPDLIVFFPGQSEHYETRSRNENRHGKQWHVVASNPRSHGDEQRKGGPDEDPCKTPPGHGSPAESSTRGWLVRAEDRGFIVIPMIPEDRCLKGTM
jgi:hypothetical protein